MNTVQLKIHLANLKRAHNLPTDRDAALFLLATNELLRIRAGIGADALQRMNNLHATRVTSANEVADEMQKIAAAGLELLDKVQEPKQAEKPKIIIPFRSLN